MTRPFQKSGCFGSLSARAAAFLFALLSGLAGAERVARAEPQDADALGVAGVAINKDYVSGKFALAQRKLERALKSCGKDRCSAVVRARLYRDLGVVLLGGLGKPQEGREALARAVQADPSIQLDRDLTTPEIAQAFKEMGGGTNGLGSDEAPKKKRRKKPPAAPTEDLANEGGLLLNWLSFTVQQDTLLHGETKPVCGGNEYTCYGVGGSEYRGPIYDQLGNQAAGGLGLATTRLLAGFDRLFLGNVLVGGRLGVAFGGAPTGSAGDKFLPLHLEARGAYFFGNEPFKHEGFRPYAALGVGVAEVDAHIMVEYYTDQAGAQAGNKGTLDAWRKVGKTFAAPSFGTQFAFLNASAVTAELRLALMLGTSGFAPALAIGYAHGL